MGREEGGLISANMRHSESRQNRAVIHNPLSRRLTLIPHALPQTKEESEGGRLMQFERRGSSVQVTESLREPAGGPWARVSGSGMGDGGTERQDGGGEMNRTFKFTHRSDGKSMTHKRHSYLAWAGSISL